MKKLTVNSIAWRNLKTRKKQYATLTLGILLAMIFSTTTVFLIFSYINSREESYKQQYGINDSYYINGDKELMEQAQNDGIFSEVGYTHIIGFAYKNEEDKDKGITIGWAEQQAKELSYMSLIEGSYPQKEGEIALEKSAVAKIDAALQPGDKFKIRLRVQNGENYLTEEIIKEYTLTGILRNKHKYLTYYEEKDKPYVPDAFVCDGTQVEPGGKESLFCYTVMGKSTYDTVFNYINSHGGTSDNFEQIQNNSNFSSSTGDSLLWGTVGATKRQIITLFGREAFLLSLISIPVSIVISYFAVKIIGADLGDDFVFIPNIASLAVCAAASLIFVLLAALLPLASASRISPVQAICNIEITRKMKRGKIQSKPIFDMPKLLSKRNLYFYRKAQAVVSLFLAITVVTSVFGFSYYKEIANEVYNFSDDYQIYMTNGYGSGNVNIDAWKYGYSENDKQYILSSSLVKEVNGSKSANCMWQLSEYNEYLAAFACLNGNFYLNKKAYSKFELPVGNKTICYGETYIQEKELASIENEMFGITLFGLDNSVIKRAFAECDKGDINIEKLSSGEEIILIAPPEVGVKKSTDGFSSISANESFDKNADNTLSATLPYEVGDEIDIRIVRGEKIIGDEHLPRNPEIISKKVKIGAIIYNAPKSFYDEVSFFGGNIALVSTNTGFDKFYPNAYYDKLSINSKNEITEEDDKEITALLHDVSDSVTSSKVFSNYAFNKENQSTYRSLLQTLIGILLLLLAASGSIINNSLTARIRENRREIGTLRAVGATNKDLIMSYINQLLSMFFWGSAIGCLSVAAICITSKISMLLEKKELIEAGFTLPDIVILPTIAAIAILFAICSLNLYLKIKKETKNSIIDNIREL